MPDSYAMTPDGVLLVANGIDNMLRWDGFTSGMEPAGVIAPTQAPTLTASGSGSISGTYFGYVRFVDGNGNVSNLSPISGTGTVAANSKTFTYANVQVPTEAKVARRQLLRNTSGQTAVFYVDVDTTDLTSTTFTSTKNDTSLSSGTPVTLFDTDLHPLANAHDPPPSTKSVIAHHLDRMFATSEVEYREGCVVLTAGSLTVSGVGTEWPATFAQRSLWADGANKSYIIQAVDVANQVLTLATPYSGLSNAYAPYSIRPAAGERRLVYYTEAGQPESWPPINAISLQEDGDVITGLMPKGSFLYILERAHIYRFTFQSDPATDGYVFLSSQRGCINNRCWVVVDDVAYMLDEAGIHAFSGGEAVEPLSLPIQDLFESESSTARDLRINWSASTYFHASYYPGQEVVRWFVALSGQALPAHAICYDIRQKRFWVEEFSVPIGCSCLGRLQGEPKVFLGGPAGRNFAFGTGSLDQALPSRGTVRGTATSSTPTALGDTAAAFDAGLVGAPLCIAGGRGKGQVRVITDVSPTTLRVDRPWLTLPDSTSVYQAGGIQWRYRTGYMRWALSEEETPRRLEIIFEPALSGACTLDARLFSDRAQVAVAWAANYSSSEANGFASSSGDTDLVADLTKPLGFVQRRIDDHRELYIDGPRYVTVELAGVSNQDPVVIYQLTVDGAGN